MGDNQTLYVTLTANAASYRAAMRDGAGETRRFGHDAERSGRQVRLLSNEIDRYSGRLRLIGQAVGAFGPGAVPIAAGVAPMITGLTSQLGSAALGAGVLVTAFQGVGDALEVLNKAQLDPTTENLAAAAEAMDGLTKEAQQAVLAMQELRPLLGQIRDAASAGFFPGFVAGLEDLERLAPQVERIFGSVAESAGGLFAGGAAELASGEWRGFFDYIEREAGPTLVTFGQTVGNFGKGFAELMMAMDPLTDRFNSGLLGMSESFEAWAEGVSQTEGFREFVDYVHETGPQVLETFGSLADMLLQVAEAASPLGGPVLQTLEAFADIVSTIADSEAGPTIMGIVAAVSAANLAMGAFNRTTQAAMGTAAVGSLRSASSAFLTVASASERAAMSSVAFAEAERNRQATVRAGLATLGKGAVLMGGMALATSDTGDSLGVTNTAMLAAMGTMAGPWGTAIGAGVGALLDLKAHAGSTTEAIEALRLEMANLADPQTADLSRFSDEIERLEADLDEMLDLGDDHSNPFTGTFDFWGDVFTMATGEYGKAEGALAAARTEYENLWKVQRGLVNDLSDAEQRRDFFDFVGLGHDARFAAGGIEDLRLQFEGLDAALQGRASMRDYEAALDAVTESIERNGRSMDINTAAGRDNEAALDAIAREAATVMETLEGAERRAFLVQARRDFRAAAAELNLTKAETRALMRAFGLLGEKNARPKVEAKGIGTTLSDIGRVRDGLAGLRDKTINITTLHRVQTMAEARRNGGLAGAPAPVGASADGGTVPKTGRAYADRHPYLLADGEEVISNRHGQADRHRGLLKAINSNRLADGGTVTSPFGYGATRFGSEPVVRGGSRPGVVVQQLIPDRVQLVVDGRSFTAYVRQHAADVGRQQGAAVQQVARGAERTNW